MDAPAANALGLIAAQHRSSSVFASVAVASAEYTHVAPKRVLWAQVDYTSGTAAGNRRPIFEIYNASNELLLRAKSIVTQSSAEVNTYIFSPGGPRETSFTASAVTVGLPQEIIIPIGGKLKFDTENGDAGDKMTVSYQVTGV